MNIIVLQHVDVEHPGIFRDYLRRDGYSWDTVQLDVGDKIPDLDKYDLMIVMGGPQDVWQEDIYPWMAEEKAAIKRFVIELGRPYLGVCLGHQLLAEAIGGAVGPSAMPEVGILSVKRSAVPNDCDFLKGLNKEFRVLQWHGAEVQSLPSEASVLASSENCSIQAFRFRRHAFGIQFHVEVTEATIDEWDAIPAYACALEVAAGKNASVRLAKDLKGALSEINMSAATIYQNLMEVIRT